MKCPICQNELEIKNKKAGETENGDTIYNEFAICHDCKKQWNLDKQRAKSDATSSRPSPDADAAKPKRKKRRPAPRPEGSAVKVSETADTSKDSAPVKRKKRPVSEAATKSNQVRPTEAPSPDAPRPKKKKRPAPKPEGEVTAVDTEVPAPRPRKKKRPASQDNLVAKDPVKQSAKSAPSEDDRPKRIKKSPPVEDPDDIEFLDEDITYSNIPPKHVRDTREKEMRTNYQNMLDEDDEDDWDENERRFPVWIIVIIVLIILAAAGFAGYWFFLR